MIIHTFVYPTKMGNTCNSGFQHEIRVVTGDRKGAGTDANIYIVLYDEDGNASGDI